MVARWEKSRRSIQAKRNWGHLRHYILDWSNQQVHRLRCWLFDCFFSFAFLLILILLLCKAGKETHSFCSRWFLDSMAKSQVKERTCNRPVLITSWKRQSDGIYTTKLIFDAKIPSATNTCESGTDGSFAMFATDMQVAVGAGERMLGHSGGSL